MRLGIRLRFTLWLLGIILPIAISGLYIFSQLENQVVERVAVDLESVRRIEAARIEDMLHGYRRQAESLASGPHVRQFAGDIAAARIAGEQTNVIAGYDGFTEINAFGKRPLREMAVALEAKARTTGVNVAAVGFFDVKGEPLGAVNSFDWEPRDPTLVERVAENGRPEFGEAFVDVDGYHRVGLATPVFSNDGDVVAVLLLENELGPVVDLVLEHEQFGVSRESHIAQPTEDGSAEFITPLRFERDAAFTKVVPIERGLPINTSLVSPNGAIVEAKDYRGEESILAIETIEETGWGLVVKIDRSEAVAPIRAQARVLEIGLGLGLLAIVLGWAVLLDPVGRRLRKMAIGAERVARGDYGTPVSDRSSDEIGAMGTAIDQLATELEEDIRVRDQYEKKLRHEATHDETTGLHNRPFASQRIQQLTEDGSCFSVLFLDVDAFKSVNDTYGHGIGDEVLVAVAKRLKSTAPKGSIAARWGGDEFVLVLPGHDEEGALEAIKDLDAVFAHPIRSSKATHQVRLSMGHASRREGDESSEAVLHRADDVMFEHKKARTGRVTVNPEVIQTVERALAENGVEVLYQPLVRHEGGDLAVVGAEALVRLRERDNSIVLPDGFIADIQTTHLGAAVDRRVIALALRQVAEWIDNKRVPEGFRIAVNCGLALVQDPGAGDAIRAALETSGLDGSHLVLELTERAEFVHPNLSETLTPLGVTIAVDDLGLSHSNFDRLIDVGASIAKIDRRWLPTGEGDAIEDEERAMVLRHLVSMCESLDMEIIAEGIETLAQLEIVKQLGISRFQGFLFSHPVSSVDFVKQFEQTSSPFEIEIDLLDTV